jgi:hypothetical protein
MSKIRFQKKMFGFLTPERDVTAKPVYGDILEAAENGGCSLLHTFTHASILGCVFAGSCRTRQ